MNDMDWAAPLSRTESNPTTSRCCAHQSHAGGVSVTPHKVPCPADSCRWTEPGWWLKMVCSGATRRFQHPGVGAVLLCRGIESASPATTLFGKETEAFIRWNRNSSWSDDMLALGQEAGDDARPLRLHSRVGGEPSHADPESATIVNGQVTGERAPFGAGG
jgi:hypothetical protein